MKIHWESIPNPDIREQLGRLDRVREELLRGNVLIEEEEIESFEDFCAREYPNVPDCTAKVLKGADMTVGKYAECLDMTTHALANSIDPVNVKPRESKGSWGYRLRRWLRRGATG